jgi:hypothetical protein
MLLQIGIPVNDQTIEYFSSFDQNLYQLVVQEANLFVPMMQQLVNYMAVALLVTVFATAGVEALLNRNILNIDYVVKKGVLPYIFATYVLQHWLNPIPGLGMSFVGIFTNTAADLAAMAHLKQLDVLDSLLLGIRDQIGPWSILKAPTDIIAWAAITTFLIAIKAAVFIITSTGFVGVGVGACIGPIYLGFYMFPPLRHKWFGWVEAMIKYSMYRVIGNLVITVWCGFLVGFIQRTLALQYDLMHIVVNMIGLFAMMLAFIFGVLKVPSFTTDFNSGGSGGGHGLMAGVAAFARGLFL